MKYLKITNKGELDIRLVALMGGTTKANDIYKIGEFGSGLKYVLAFLFRNNIDFKIYSGSKQIGLSLETELIREEEFEIICIDGKRTSITTKMGKDWEPWMIIREIWSNSLDEGEATREITQDVHGVSGYTSFYIQLTNEIQDVFSDWDKYFIVDKQPIWSNGQFGIYPGGNSLRLYKQGILIHENDKKKSLFAYDIKEADINELREFKGSAPFEITKALCKANEKVATYLLENITDEYYEGIIEYSWWQSWGESWRNVIGQAKLIHKEALDNLRGKESVTIDEKSLIVVPKGLYQELTKQFEGIGALMAASKNSEFYECYNEESENKVKQALVILEACNYPLHPELEFKYGYFENKSYMACVKMDEKKILISNTLIQKPLVDVVATIVEETEHYNTGFSDETRAFQQHFIDLYVRELLSKNKIEI